MRNNTHTTEIINGFTFVIDENGRCYQVPAGGTEDDGAGDDKDAGGAGDAGGTGDDDDAGAGDSAQDDGEEVDGEGKPRAAADKGEKGSAGYQKRLQSVIKERNAYRAYGSPDEVRRLRERVAEYDKFEAQAEREAQTRADQAARAAGQPTIADQNALLDRMLTQRYGPGAPEDFGTFRETRVRDVQRHTKEGLDHLRSMLTEVNIKPDKPVMDTWERHIGTELLGDDELRASFKDPVTQKDALTEAFRRVRASLVDPALAAVGASKLDAARRRRATAPGSAGVSSAPHTVEKDLKPPKTMTDPIERQRWWDAKVSEAIAEQDAYDGV